MADASVELSNWAGNHRYAASFLHHPESVDELRALAASARSLSVLNTRHSFNAIGDSEQLVALNRLAGAGEIAIDRAAMQVTVGAAVTYAQLALALQEAGLA